MFKKILGISICMICLGFSNVSAEVITVEGDGECPLGPNTTPDEAMKFAREYALRDASQKVAVHVKSISKSVDHAITEDEIELISASVLSVKDGYFIPSSTSDNKFFVAKYHVVANVDDNNIWEQFRKNDAEFNAAMKKIAELEEENKRLRSSKESLHEVKVKAKGRYAIGEGSEADLEIGKERARDDALRNATTMAGIYVSSKDDGTMKTITGNVVSILK
ncbi:MAG: hypothetical protein IJ575_08265 [Selenomonadaceae bacterium]|nr:hypothetical protein [Selenomonadaceae bacterium]